MTNLGVVVDVPLQVSMSHAGYLTRDSDRTDVPRYGNWGSRPYEYGYAARAVARWQGLRVLDLGCSIPSSHTFGAWFFTTHQPEIYLGVDNDDRMKVEAEKFSRPPGEVYLHGDFTKLVDVPDQSQDVVLFLSVQEHLTAEVLRDTVSEVDRVLSPVGVVILTMDEVWNVHRRPDDLSSWNELEKDLPGWLRLGNPGGGSLNLKQVVDLFWVPTGFAPVQGPVPVKQNQDPNILHSEPWNCCVSYATLQRKVQPPR